MYLLSKEEVMAGIRRKLNQFMTEGDCDGYMNCTVGEYMKSVPVDYRMCTQHILSKVSPLSNDKGFENTKILDIYLTVELGVAVCRLYRVRDNIATEMYN